jgi:phosphoserine phosphatase
MPSVSKKQHGFMAAVANNPKFAKKVGISKSVGEEFMKADKGRKFKEGGALKETDAESNPGLAKLPTEVRNKMGYMKKGGMAHSDIKKDMPMMKKVAGEAVKGHEKKMHGMAKGGVTRADGCVSKGHTKGKMIKMTKGGMC